MIEYLESVFVNELAVLFKVLFSVLVGYVIGYERQKAKKSAGLRTHILVCMSSCMVVAVSVAAFPVQDSASKILSAVITGIGFLGAGQIMTTGGKVSGITTAASIWTNALIGSVIGLGYYLVAIFATVVAILTFRMKKTTFRR